MPATKFTGLGTAIVTPFRKDESVDFKSFEKLIQYQVKGGIDYLVVLGTTGETATLSKDEKIAVVSFVKEVVDKRIPIVLGIGGNNTRDISNQINSFDLDDIAGILSVSPYYNKPNQQGIYQHYKTIASICPLPIIMYNVPSRTGSNMDAETTLKLAHDVKNIVAIKEASGNLEQIMKIIQYKPSRFEVISGDDLMTLPLIALGGKGLISVSANAFPESVSALVHDLLKGKFEEARKHHYKLMEITGLLFAEGNPTGVKAALMSKGLIDNNLRLPLVPASKSLFSKIAKLIETENLV